MTRWEQLYQEDSRVMTTGPSSAAERAAALFRQHGKWRIVDVGCGVGRDSFFLASQGLQVVGIDAAAAAIALAGSLRRERGAAVSFLRGDARALPLAGQAFDGVYCFGLLHEFVGDWEESSAAVLGEIWRVLRPGGLVVLTACAGDPAAGLPQVQLFSEEMFAAAIQRFILLEKDNYCDRGCTGRADYRVWYASLQKE